MVEEKTPTEEVDKLKIALGADESKPVEEQPLSFAEKMDIKKKEIDASIKIADEKLAELKEFKAVEVLSGKIDAGQPVEEKKEETPSEYTKRITGI